MKEHPILFSGEMVKAILEGRKTQTRRIVKPQPDENGITFMKNSPVLDWDQIYKEEWKPFQYDTWEGESKSVFCPYGKAGDQLWVRETFGKDFFGKIYYKADDLFVPVGAKAKWKPSIFMPRNASRIQLEIVNIRVERLDNISEEDAKAEGIEGIDGKYLDYSNTKSKQYCLSAFSSYEELWIKINGKESWEKNPWVWKIEFKRIN